MTLAELIAKFRSEADDAAVPYLWSDAEVIGFLNEAQNEAADRAKLIWDNVTPAVCQVTLVAGTSYYNLHSSILEIQSAVVRGQLCPLVRVPGGSRYRHLVNAGIPTTYSMEGQAIGTQTSTSTIGAILQLDTAPAASGYIDLCVWRLPIYSLVSTAPSGGAPDGRIPEIPPRYHVFLVDWALHLAFRKRDSDSSAMQRSEDAKRRFVANFGDRFDANVQRKHLSYEPPVITAALF